MLSVRGRSGGGSVRAGDAGRRPTSVDPLGAARHPHARRAQHGPVRSQTALRRYGHHSAPSSSAAADGALLGRSFSTSNLVFLVCRSLSVARSRRLSLHFVVPAQVVEPISTTAAGMARTFFQDAFVFHVFSVLDPVGGGAVVVVVVVVSRLFLPQLLRKVPCSFFLHRPVDRCWLTRHPRRRGIRRFRHCDVTTMS